MLGGLRARYADRTIDRFRTQKTGVLLAYLAYCEVLMEMLWPGGEPQASRNGLRVALSSLRRQLEPPGTPAGSILQTDHLSIQLNPAAVTTDVEAFEAELAFATQADGGPERRRSLERAVDLYSGVLLPGCYENWILSEQERLTDRFYEAVRRLTEMLEQAGEIQRALEYARLAVHTDPLAEPAQRDLIRLLASTGQIEAALRCYRQFEQLLKQELHTSPTAVARELVRSIESGRIGTAAANISVRQAEKTPPAATLAAGDQTPYPDRAPREFPALGAEAGYASRLPIQFTRFFGRSKELALLQETLLAKQTRLVTITGSGGTGKTRLALEAASRLWAPMAGAVWFVPLADLPDACLLPGLIAETLDLPCSSSVSPLEGVLEALSHQPSLLILDNFEQLVEAGAPVVQLLLQRAPSLLCLVTSRRRLDLDGEQEFALAPLATPHETEAPEQLAQNESMQLLIDRAQAVRPDFQITPRNASTLARLCDRLEGIPLALELAAARASVLTSSQMLEQLTHRFDFLVSRRRGVSERHRTLHAAIDWSYRLLPEELQRLFVQLSVFRGGWTVEAAAAVCILSENTAPAAGGGLPAVSGWEQKKAPGGEQAASLLPILDRLAQLREASLILAEEMEGRMRFRMLETLREFAWEQARDESERIALRERHQDWFLRLAEQVGSQWKGADIKIGIDRLQADHDNLRAALDWRRTTGENTAAFLRLCVALFRFWYTCGLLSEGRRWLGAALAGTEEQGTALRAAALCAAANLAGDQSDYEEAIDLSRASLALFQQLDDLQGMAQSSHALAYAHRRHGDYAEASVYFEAALLLWRNAGNQGGYAQSLNGIGSLALAEGDYSRAILYSQEALDLFRTMENGWGVGVSLNVLGSASCRNGDYALAMTFHEEALALQRELGNRRGMAFSLNSKGEAARGRRNSEQAKDFYMESLMLFREIGDRSGAADVLENLAQLAQERECCHRSARLFGAAKALRATTNEKTPLEDQRANTRALTTVRARLSEEAFTTAWAEGRAMRLDQAVAYAQTEDP